jgi:AraC family transcriptional regulator
MDVPFHTVRRRLVGYASRRISRGGHEDFSGPAGDVALFAAGEQGRWEYHDPVDCVEIYVTRRQLALIGDREGYSRIDITDRRNVEDPILGALTSELAALCWSKARESLYVETLVTALVLRIARAHAETHGRETPAKDALPPWIWRRVDEFLRANMAQDVSLSQLAAQTDLPPFVFSRMFRQRAGTTPFGYQRRLRIELARRLLRETEFSIAEIASQVGFKTPDAFADAFEAVTGIPPAKWRASARVSEKSSG